MPSCTASAPSANAATIPRASAIPPAATTGTSTASTICGTNAIVPTCAATSLVRNMPRCPPASAPWAMTTSTAVVLEPARLGYRRRRRHDRGTRRPHPLDQWGRGQPELEAHDLRAELLHDLAQGLVEGHAPRCRSRAALDPELFVVVLQPAAPCLERGRARLGRGVAEEVDVDRPPCSFPDGRVARCAPRPG